MDKGQIYILLGLAATGSSLVTVLVLTYLWWKALGRSINAMETMMRQIWTWTVGQKAVKVAEEYKGKLNVIGKVLKSDSMEELGIYEQSENKS